MARQSSRRRTIGTGQCRRARSRRPIESFPEPKWTAWEDPPTFAEALDLHMRRHGDGAHRLRSAIVALGDTFSWETIRDWRRGDKEPQSLQSFEMLSRIEARYRLSAGYFKEKLSNRVRASSGFYLPSISQSERRRLSWHLPDDFDRRSEAERAEILEWVRRVIVSGATEYRRFQALAIRDRYALRFRDACNPGASRIEERRGTRSEGTFHDDELLPINSAPRALQHEMDALVRFKTSTLTEIGYQRTGVWGEETRSQRVEHLGLLFGALAASPAGRVKGLGVPHSQLSFALLVFPAVWDWYVQWREKRRGFYTKWEVDMLRLALSLTRRDFGWMRQSPELAERLHEIPELVTGVDVERAKSDWNGACDLLYAHGQARAREIERVAKVHRDPFEPVLSILEADSPLAEYRLITEEILRRLPDARRYPRCAAEAVRSFLMLRLGLHLGVRQKNLRQLLHRRRGDGATPERTLDELRCGELRWSERDGGWEVLIPSSAFKNSRSSYFANKPFRLLLADLGRLYEFIDRYLMRDRAVLLANAADPGTFFIKTVKATSKSAAYDQTTFYEAWRLITQRYGVYNPYTQRGAIKGLLPHGPHNVRDVLATHILKQTGSYERASYAIQDTPQTVAQHYGRFLPQDKAALAAQVLNLVWAEQAKNRGD